MNAAEHIVQSFFWHARSDKKPRGRRYLTLSNMVGGNNSEIDLLAISGDGQDRLRVECHVDVNWALTPGYVEYLKRDCVCKKMLSDEQRRTITEQLGWGDGEYRKVLVVWKNPFDIQALRTELNDDMVDVWSITDLIQDLLSSVGNANFQDDVLRLMAMLSSMLSVERALRDSGCKRVSGWSVSETTATDCVKVVAELAAKCASDTRRATVTSQHVKEALCRIRSLCGEKTEAELA
jgi:histone H3/H4